MTEALPTSRICGRAHRIRERRSAAFASACVFAVLTVPPRLAHAFVRPVPLPSPPLSTKIPCPRLSGIVSTSISFARRYRSVTVPPSAYRRSSACKVPLFSAAVPRVGWDEDGDEDEEGDEETDSAMKGPVHSSKMARRPDWAPDWMPTWLVSMPPTIQLLVGLAMYIFHLTVLTQHGVAFPVQLIPNDKGRFQSVGWDSLAGIFSLIGLIWLRKTTENSPRPSPVPPLWRSPTRIEAPWQFPKKLGNVRLTSAVAFVALTFAYFSTGRFAHFFETGLYALAGMGVPLTIAMHRSLVVLLGHLAWVGIGSCILRWFLTPKPFFGGGWRKGGDKFNGSSERQEGKKLPAKFKWYTNRMDTLWLFWTLGGYFVSSWLFNVADFLNQVLLPASVFELAGEGVVSQLINPENNDFVASLVGYIAPCISAPWWEEVLYRGFMLPALCLFMKFWPAVFVSGVVFSAHHLSTTGAIPLAVLGWTWAAVYAKSGNILVTILIHAMWNSRVFLGSWLGL